MDWNHTSNEELLRLYGKGHFQAFDTFFKRNNQSIFLYILSRVGDQTVAEDIVQETFFRLHKYIHRYDPKRHALHWVFSIAKNQMLTHISKRVEHFELNETMIASRQQVCYEAKDELEKILSHLDESDRSLLIDRFLSQKDYEEMSQKRNLTPVNTRKKVSRLLQKIRSMF